MSWEKTKEQEKDARFVELGEYLCEVRSKQYWRFERLKSFDEFLAKRFPDSRRKAYYLTTIHEHLTSDLNRRSLRAKALRFEDRTRSVIAGSNPIADPNKPKLLRIIHNPAGVAGKAYNKGATLPNTGSFGLTS